MKSNKIGIIIAVVAIVLAIIAIAVACYTVATVKAEKEEETVSSKKEEKSDADVVLENARKAREDSYRATAKDAIVTALSSIQTEYYRSAGADDSAEDYLTKEAIEEEIYGRV